MGDAGLKRIHIGKIGLGSVLVALGFPGSLAFAQPMTVQLIKELVVVDIPFVLGDVEAGERSDMLWARGTNPPIRCWRVSRSDLSRRQPLRLLLQDSPALSCGAPSLAEASPCCGRTNSI